MSESVTGSTLLVVTASVTAFTALMPKFGEVRRAVGNPDTVNDVRMGEVAALGMTVAIGVTASSLTKSPVPAMVGVVSALALVCMYESVLQAIPTESKEGKAHVLSGK